ncbi:putative endosomal integral membrane protein [Trypanosoma conorhini]|uniref:Putative endosomal integral membrane protein n=1 Tax=Trypanosoma conorhini TaxID=83891 RepID=A0A422MUW6_9TRYP|nr:putative endosomal integral membrane protein [Trypanosoma conorhini]RNE96997.1 putative endosomal integral membrane protein [Trypanosoma conorhini]
MGKEAAVQQDRARPGKDAGPGRRLDRPVVAPGGRRAQENRTKPRARRRAGNVLPRARAAAPVAQNKKIGRGGEKTEIKAPPPALPALFCAPPRGPEGREGRRASVGRARHSLFESSCPLKDVACEKICGREIVNERRQALLVGTIRARCRINLFLAGLSLAELGEKSEDDVGLPLL